jgi:arylsulfatase A-like enzyme
MDELAKTSVLYEHAYSPSTWTLPSHFSMLRGVPVYRGPQRARDAKDDIGKDTTALASVFRDAGYLTAGFTGGGYVSYRFGFSEGFDSYYSHPQAKPAKPGCWPDRFDGPEVLRRTKQWLGENGDRPFFLFVQTYDAHDRCPVIREGKGAAKWDSSPEGRKRMSAHYDAVITQADGILGDVLAEIASIDPEQRITIVVTSDHGELLWEHGAFGHGCESKPYDPLVRVPLIVRLAARQRGGERVATPVSVGSIATTLLALAGIPRPENMQLGPLPGLELDGSEEEEPVYVSCESRLAVRSQRHKLLTTRAAPRFDEVYDLESDPGEFNNLAHERPDLTSELRSLANTYWQQASSEGRGRSPGKKRVLDEATHERLRALGYYE